MVYITGKIMGNYEKYKELLNKIKLRQSDELYILGDIAGNTADGIDILIDMSMRSNIFPILGDNEIELIQSIKSEGSGTAYDRFSRLDEESKIGLVEYLADIPLYDELELGGKDYLLLHALPKCAEADLKSLMDRAEIPELNSFTVICAHEANKNNYVTLEREMPQNSTLFALRLNDGAEFFI